MSHNFFVQELKNIETE